MKKITIYLLLFVSTNLIAQELKVGENHRGVVNLGSGYQIFPENRIDNSLYGKDGKLQEQYPNKIIVDALDYKGHLFIIVEGVDKKRKIISQNPKNGDIKFIASQYIQLTQEGEKYFFRYNANEHQLEPVNIPYKSVRGFEHNQKNTLAFYRIVRYIPPDPEVENSKSTFSLKVSVFKEKENQIVDIPGVFVSTSARGTLKWTNDETIIFSLREGAREILVSP